MVLLIASILALFAGPALMGVLARRRAAMVAVDAFVVLAIAGLVFFDILPDSVAATGWPALLAAVAGMLAPVALHGPLEDCQHRGTTSLLSLAVAALGVHAFLDGIALVGHNVTGPALAVAIILHRVLEGLGVWWLVRPHHGARGTVGVVSIIAAATTVGFWAGDRALQGGLEPVMSMIQAMVAGSLLHVLLRHAPPAAALPRGRWQWASCVGGLGGCALTGWLHLAPHTAAPGAGLGVKVAGSLAVHVAPYLLAALGMVVLSHALMRHRPGPRPVAPWLQALRGALTPALGCAGVMCSWALLGWQLTLLRAMAVVALAILASLGAAPNLAVSATRIDGAAPPLLGPGQALLDGLHFAFGEVLDAWAPWILLGLALSSLVAQVVQPEWFFSLRQARFEVPMLVLLGMPFYFSAAAATLVGASLLAKGATVGAVAGFMIASSAAAAWTPGRLGRALHAASGLVALLFGYLVNAWGISASGGARVQLPAAYPVDAISWGCVGLLAGLFLLSFVRQGVRAFLGQVVVPAIAATARHHHHGHIPGR